MPSTKKENFTKGKNSVFYNVPVLIIIILLNSCNGNGITQNKTDNVQTSSSAQSTTNPSAASFQYDLAKPAKKWVLPESLLEISGNTYIDKDHLLVIEDLHPNLYLLRLGNDTVTIEKTVPFKEDQGKKFDVEDVTIVNNIVYALWSHGSVFKIKDWQGRPQVQEVKMPLSKENNTEGICYDPVTHNLLVACKNESSVADEKQSTRAIYEYDIKGDSLKTEPFLLIHKKDFKKAIDEKIEFFPSAIAVHPITHDIYILSTKENKVMAQYSHDGQLKSAQFINKDLLLQPEGICFAPDGTMYISTEGKHGTPALIYQFNSLK